MRARRWTMRGLAAVLALVLALPEAAFAQINLYSREQEVQLGRQAAAEVEKQLPVLPESDPVARYVRALGERLAAKTPEPKYPYTFKVVNQKEINAFALPGGPVYINLGVLRAAENEAEVAGVMGHEIAHVFRRHGTQQATKGALAQGIAAVLGGLVGGGTGGTLAQLGIQMTGGLVLMKYSRGAETEADRHGAKLLYEAGYDPQAMVDFFRKLEKGGGRGGPEFLSSHPNPGNRASTVSKAISGLPSKSYRRDNREFANVKQVAMGMKPLSAQEVAEQQKAGGQQASGPMQQVSASDVMPSGQMEVLESSAFRMKHPSNWEVARQQDGPAVRIAPKAGVSGNAIAYGVLANVFAPKSTKSLGDATHELIQQIRSGNPEVKAVGSPHAIKVNGVAGRSVDLTGPSPVVSNGKALTERDWLVTLQRNDGTLLYLLFISPEKDFEQLRPAFENMLRSVRLQ